jgi:peptidoglycan/LPS O-acetylase OafA/YrhL
VGAALSLVVILAVPLNVAKKDWLILAAALLFFCLTTTVLLSEGASWLAPLRVRWLTQLGVISYGVYLYHVPIILGFEVALRRIGISHPMGMGRPWWRAGLEVTTALTVALLSWRFIERPILRLRERIGAGRERERIGAGEDPRERTADAQT